MSSVAMYARIKPMTDAAGRADYISNPDRQENLLAVSGQTDMEFWRQLSHDAQAAWRSAGGSKERKTCEAREVHFQLPRCVMDLSEEDLQKVADSIAQLFREKYGVDCLVGIHISKTDLNVHAHVLFSERELLPEPVIKRADRNAFLDENGIRKRTKKEIMDDAGQLRPGCKIVPKGEVLSARHFGEKDDSFSSKSWAAACKADLAAWINEELHPDKERIVFDRSGPYLAQIHVGRGRPAEQAEKIREHNRLVRVYNDMIQKGLDAKTIQKEDALDRKTQLMLAPDRALALKEMRDHKPLRGGRRTSTGKEAELKKQLREHYRLAAEARKKSKEAKSGIDQKTWSAEARKQSQLIDQLKIQLGYIQAKDEKERRQWEERERMLKYRDYWRRRTSMRYCSNRIQSLEKERSRLFEEYWNCGLFDFAEMSRIEAEMDRVDQEIEEARAERREARLEARALRGEIKELRAAARAEKTAAQRSGQRAEPDRGR